MSLTLNLESLCGKRFIVLGMKTYCETTEIGVDYIVLGVIELNIKIHRDDEVEVQQTHRNSRGEVGLIRKYSKR